MLNASKRNNNIGYLPDLPTISMDIFPNETLNPLSHINQIFGRIAEAMKP
ncbi:uncharacterized protein HKW66_Vig0159030 [Vigna angularis]|uniref:Uncharacterized protein n=1 Tax=Phaseolus angularis TaxID=3914 RepID=A0A8T0JM01_PHAAN|nr:uncharacterized protein HKW66_Vig0159030 [Vigna angularis]